jgi:hypothetical protein
MAEGISIQKNSHSTIQGKHFLSDKVSQFTESEIREMTRQAMVYGAVNLAQGFPDFAAAGEIKEAARAAIEGDVNQYAITWGAKNLQQCYCTADGRVAGDCGRSGERSYGVLRIDGGDDFDIARGVQCGR